MAREIDIVIAPESSFLAYAFNGTMASLTEVLPSDLYGALSNRFFLSKVRQENEGIEDAKGEDYVLGIYLDNTPDCGALKGAGAFIDQDMEPNGGSLKLRVYQYRS